MTDCWNVSSTTNKKEINSDFNYFVKFWEVNPVVNFPAPLINHGLEEKS